MTTEITKEQVIEKLLANGFFADAEFNDSRYIFFTGEYSVWIESLSKNGFIKITFGQNLQHFPETGCVKSIELLLAYKDVISWIDMIAAKHGVRQVKEAVEKHKRWTGSPDEKNA